MPLYTISTTQALPETTKHALANLIMHTHCGLTGAPETFVNVVFSQNVPIKQNATINVMGAVRKGRTAEMNQVLETAHKQKIAELLAINTSEVDLSLFEVPAAWVMEGGEILPEPGEEDQCEWLQNGHAS